MAQPDGVPFAPQPQAPGKHSFLRKLLGRPSSSASSSPAPTEVQDAADDGPKPGLIRRMSRKVVPGLPRHQTFKRQQEERRQHLAPIQPTAEERRAVSVDRRSHRTRGRAASQAHTNPRASAPSLLGDSHLETTSHYEHSLPASSIHDEPLDDPEVDMTHDAPNDFDGADRECPIPYAPSITTDTRSMTTAEYDAMIHEELEKVWILNLSMHFRDRSKREKFFVTYREDDHLWRRVTVSLDYRDAPEPSLEHDLIHTKYQRDKSAKIYEAIRESLPDIQFYDTVTNLKLETTDGRLHVHVVEDGNEIIQYPTISQVRHLNCRRIRERDIVFDSHMSGFVYKVNVKGNVLIKKEIPSPDTVDEFLYEVNALNSLRFSKNVIQFYGVVVDDHEEYVKGLLISYADQGALIDLIYDNCKENSIGLPWSTREKWARQIVQGLADIHESGFVQGDFTLSNIVIDNASDAKIIDINRRGCPVGWEPPEATALIESNQRLSMYIGVKSDLYQLGMVLWGLAMLEDEPEAQGRPLILGPEVNVPDWYRQMTEICLSDDPRMRLQASSLLQMFPRVTTINANGTMHLDHEPISVEDGPMRCDYFGDAYRVAHPVIRTVEPPSEWAYSGTTYVNNGPLPYDPYYFPRGRSPPSPLPSNYDGRDSSQDMYYKSAWAANRNIAPSYSDNGDYDVPPDNDSEVSRQPTPTPTAEKLLAHGLGDLPTPGPSHPAIQGDADCSAPGGTTEIEAVNMMQEITEERAGLANNETALPSNGSVADGVPDVIITEAIDSGYIHIESPKVEKSPEQGIHVDDEQRAIDPDSPMEKPEAVAAADKAGTKDQAAKGEPASGFQIAAEYGERKPASLETSDVKADGPKGDVIHEKGSDRTSSPEAEGDNKVDEKTAPLVSTCGSEEANSDGLKDQNTSTEENLKTQTMGFTPLGDIIRANDGHELTLSPSKEEDLDEADVSSNETITDTNANAVSLQNDENSRTQQEAEAEPEPEYIASRTRGTTVPNSQEAHNDAEQTHEASSGGDTRQSWAHWKDAPKPIEPPRGYMCPRQTSIPLSLAGIGAHMGMNGELFQEKMDGDFQMMVRPETVPTIMITTDSRT